MHVENLAVFDTTYESNAFSSVVNQSEPPIESNLSQVAAVGAICNSATFDTDTSSSNSDEKKVQGRGIIGNATGNIRYISFLRLHC